jgi:hypothetical protein
MAGSVIQLSKNADAKAQMQKYACDRDCEYGNTVRRHQLVTMLDYRVRPFGGGPGNFLQR